MSVPFWAAVVLVGPYFVELALGLYAPAFLGRIAFWAEDRVRVPWPDDHLPLTELGADRAVVANALKLELHPERAFALVTTVGGFRNRAVGALATIIHIDLRVDGAAVVLSPRTYVFPLIGFVGLPIALIADLVNDARHGRDVSFAGAGLVILFVVGLQVLARLGSRRANARKLAWAIEVIGRAASKVAR